MAEVTLECRNNYELVMSPNPIVCINGSFEYDSEPSCLGKQNMVRLLEGGFSKLV